MAALTVEEFKLIILDFYESRLNQDSPLNDKAYTRITSSAWGTIAALMQKEILKKSLENLAITADVDGLTRLGLEFSVPRKLKQAAVLTATMVATTGVQIIAGTDFISDTSGVVYFNAFSATAVANVVTLEITARTPGVNGNLENGEILKTSRVFAGAEQTATITATVTNGTNDEDVEVWRRRILDIIRSPGGGGNAADFRNWAQEEPGIERAYCFAGLPFGSVGYPGASPKRTVYLKADSTIHPDGITPPSLIASTRETIITDPVTEQHRQALGITNDTLFVESIRTKLLYTQIIGSEFKPGTDAQVKAEADAEIAKYMKGRESFMLGTDAAFDKVDTVTAPSITKLVQSIYEANEASFLNLSFGEVPGSVLPKYILAPGELTKSGGVTYV